MISIRYIVYVSAYGTGEKGSFDEIKFKHIEKNMSLYCHKKLIEMFTIL